MAEDDYIRYFMFSASQMKLKKEIAEKLGRELVLGTVIIKGEAKQFTEIVKNPNSMRYSDAQIVAQGDIRTIKYTNPE